MMSTVPAISFSKPGLVNQFTVFQTGFTPWEMDCSDFFSTIHLEPVMPSPCSGESEIRSVKINTDCNGSDESNSNSDVTNCFNGVPSPQSEELESENTRIRINATNSGLIRAHTGLIKSNAGSDVTNCFNGVTSPKSEELESENTRIRINATNSGSIRAHTGLIKSNSGSDVTNCFNGVTSPQSDELDSENTKIRINVTNSDENGRKKLNRPVSEVIDDRKRKWMESNRESARRSRMRKQRLIKNLEDEVNRLGLENRELNNRLRIVLYHIEQICTDNNLLFMEQELLRGRLILRQLQQNMI